MQLHLPCETYGSNNIEHQRKTLKRVVTHQLIILENQLPQMIEDFKIKDLE